MFKATLKNPSRGLSLMLTYESFLHRRLTWLCFFFLLFLSLWRKGGVCVCVSSNLSLFLCLANRMTVSEMSKYVPAGSYSLNKTWVNLS